MRVECQAVLLGDISTVSAGNPAPQDKALFANGTYPFIRTSDVGQVRFGSINSAADYLNAQGIKKLKRYEKGTILIPKSGASTFLNHRVIMDVDGYVASHLATIRAHDDMAEPRFLLYWLSTVQAQDLIQDHKYPSLNLSVIKSIQVPLPPLPEQQRIIAILDDAFTGMATAKTNTKKIHRNAHALFESYSQSVLSRRGEGWVEKPLSDICDIKHGFGFEGEFFSNEGNYILLTPGNFYETGGYRDRGEKQKYYNGKIPPGFILKKGDLLVAMTEQAAGLLGSSILVPESDKFLHNQRLGLVIKKPGAPWISGFFYHVFNTGRVRAEIHRTASGVKVRHTSPTKIGMVVVCFPTSISEQSAIAARLTELETETHLLKLIYERKLAALEALKKSLLHQAFSGDL